MLAAAALCALAACAPSSYAGISFAAGSAPAELQSLARRAEAGDKQAQLELGIAYEEGRGVAVDLGRARDLYFDAATDEGETSASIFLPRPNAIGGGIQRPVAGPMRLSDNEEAIRRWHALSQDFGVAGAQTVSAGFVADPSEWAAVQSYAIGNFSYRPIFNGLKSAWTSLDQALLSEQPSTVISPFTVDQTLIYLTDKEATEEPGAALDEASARAFCERQLGPPIESSVDIRMTGICALEIGDRGAAALQRAATAASQRFAGFEGRSPDRAFLNAVNDIVFIWRVANRMGDDDAAGMLVGYLPTIAAHHGALSERCEDLACSPDEQYVIQSYRTIQSQIMLAIFEQPSTLLDAQGELAPMVAGLFNRSFRFAPVQNLISPTCARLGIAETVCRDIYSYEPALDGHIARIIGEFVLADSPAVGNCATLRQRRTGISRELQYRADLDQLFDAFAARFCAENRGV